MSTRCHIAICRDGNEQEDGKFLHLSHHCDGYPSGVGSELVEYLREYTGPWEPESLQKYINEKDNDYRITDKGVTWDQEYVYIINCEKQKLSGYSKGLSKDFDLRWPGDECIIPGNVFSDEAFKYEGRHHTAFILAIECLNQHGWFNRESDLKEVFDYFEKNYKPKR